MRRTMWTVGIGTSAMVLAPLAGCTNCKSCSTGLVQPEDKVELLAGYLTGAFSSAEQAAEDPENYFDIRLVCVPIWESRDDGPWLYIEQAVASSPERPYRQRIYRIEPEADGRVRSDVFTLPGDPLEYAGDWRTPEVFDAIQPADLELRAGCSVFLELDGEAFIGGTEGEGCSSSLGEAAYATSEMTLFPTALITWDRGWTPDGEQAWGAEIGGYVFERVQIAD